MLSSKEEAEWFGAESFEAEGEFEFQVYAFINDDDDEWGDPIGQPMPEKSYLSGSDEFHYIGFDSIEECKKYIKDLPKGWSGYIEVIVYDKEDFSKVRPEVISYEEYQKNMGAESFEANDLTPKEYAKLAQSIERDVGLPYKRDDYNDAYVEGYIDCVVDNGLQDKSTYNAESFEADGGNIYLKTFTEA